MTCVDTKILIVNAIGSNLTTALLFGRRVLSVKWWRKYVFTNSQNKSGRQEQVQEEQKQQKLEDANMTFTSSHHHMTQPKSQFAVHVEKEKLSKWNYDYFKNKKVFTCEMVDIGYVTMFENQFMTVTRNGRGRQPQYVIPTYYVRECDNERIVIDTSVRYLNRYQVKENTSA